MAGSERTDPRGRLGNAGESAACRLLENRGWRILGRNVRWREGELDIVGLDGRTLAFVEVKALAARNGTTPFSPFESINPLKQRRIRMLARRWISEELPKLSEEKGGAITGIRFDAVAVTVGANGAIDSCEHLPDAF